MQEKKEKKENAINDSRGYLSNTRARESSVGERSAIRLEGEREVPKERTSLVALL